MQKVDKNNTLIFGNGQMAGFIKDYFGNATISTADITKPDEIKRDIDKFKPSAVINTAAMTSIDWCEQNKVEAFAVNTLGALNVWNACKDTNVFMMHFSSGCIFHSFTDDQIFTEDSKPSPRCYYSWTKVWAENLLGSSSNLLIIRPRMVISSKVDRRNTLAKWTIYTHFISDQNTLSVVEDMLPVMKDLVRRRISGTFNIANQGTISPLEVAYLLKEKINPKMEINETTLDEVNNNLIAKRCTTVLSCDKLRTLGYVLPNAKDSIVKVIDEFKKNVEAAGGLKALNVIRDETKQKYSVVGDSCSTYTGTN